MNCSIVVTSSVGHGPCGAAHTMDVIGAIIVASELGKKTTTGMLEATMDDYVSTYDFNTAKVQFKDVSSNLLVVGGSGVNQVTWHYNNLRNSSGARVLPVYFDKDQNGIDCIHVATTGHDYKIEHDNQGRITTDYGIILMFQDNSRYVLILAGLGGSGTWASCKVVSSSESWNLNGNAAVVKYSDNNSDGLLDDLTIVEEISGTQFSLNFSGSLALGLPLAVLLPKWKSVKEKIARKRRLLTVLVLLFLALASQISFTAFSSDLSSEVYTFKDFSKPFVSSSGLMNCSMVVASSVGHGPCGAAHTMDVIGAIIVASGLGMDTVGGAISSTLDDCVSAYDDVNARISFPPLTSNLLVVGGPGVNQVTWHYNNLRNSSGARVLPVYFDKDQNGIDCIHVATTGHDYKIEHDNQGRITTDYGIITLYHDTDQGVWVLIAAGLGGAGTLAASRLLTSHKNWSLFGQAIVVKYADSNGDGYLDAVSISESVGTSKSIDVYSDAQCMNSVQSIDWGMLSPGDAKSVTVYVRNEGEDSTALSVNAYNWTPVEASSYMRIDSNYSGTPVDSGQVVAIVLTLTVDSKISQITDFSVTVDVGSG